MINFITHDMFNYSTRSDNKVPEIAANELQVLTFFPSITYKCIEKKIFFSNFSFFSNKQLFNRMIEIHFLGLFYFLHFFIWDLFDFITLF